ncbi:MAG: TIGR00374 family protein [Hyphomicrobiales bacterium]|nr:MAG: TIGR00374 family protein [Hyphomicrobiales bacterium]
MNAKNLLKLVFGFGLLAALLMMADWRALFAMGKRVDVGFAITGMMSFVATSLFDMWRFRLASPAAQHLLLVMFARINLESYIMAQLMPGHTGMDAYRIAMVGRAKNQYVEPTAVLFSLRLFNLLIMLLLSACFLVVLPEWRQLIRPVPQHLLTLPPWLIVLGFIGAAGGGYVIWRLLSRFGNHLKGRLSGVSEAYHALTLRRSAWLVLLSLMIIATRILTFFFALQAFGGGLPFLLAASIALFAALSWLLPLSPAGIGVREGVITGLLVTFGFAFDTALAVALLNRAYFLLFAGLGGISFLLPKTQSQRRDDR